MRTIVPSSSPPVWPNRSAPAFTSSTRSRTTVGWVEEIRPEQLPEVHQAIELEARERLAGLIPIADQERLNINLVLRMGPADRELTAFTEEQNVDLAILQAPLSNPRSVEIGRALIDHGRCAVLVLR